MNGITGTRFRRGAPVALNGGLRVGGSSAPVVEECG
jgi:hypothetical protein